MKNVERIRESLLGIPAQDYFRQRAFAGWKPVAIVWEREIEAPAGDEPLEEEVPYGLSIDASQNALVENSREKEVILKIIEGIVQDQRIAQIAEMLNRSSYLTRAGSAWTARDVFELLPRLVEVGPRVFPTHEWAQRRHHLFHTA